MQLPDVSDGPIFSLAREKIGEKRVLGCVWCILHLNSGKHQFFSLVFHSILTSRASNYAPPDTGESDLQLVALERLPSIEGSAEILIGATFLRGSITSPPHFVRHLPLTRGGLWGAHSKAPLVKGSWRRAPEGLAPPQRKGSPFRGAVCEAD